MMTTQEHKLV